MSVRRAIERRTLWLAEDGSSRLAGQRADLTDDLTNEVMHAARKPETGLKPEEALWRTRTADPLLTMEVLYRLR